MIKLLLADDEPLVLVGMMSMLNWADYGIELCTGAHNGEQAMQIIGEQHPDIVVTDIKMPLKTGLEVARECGEKYGVLPVFILLTSYEEFGFIKDAIHLGVIEYLIKLEITPQSLASAITKAIQRVNEIHRVDLPAENIQQKNLQMFRDRFFVRLYNNLFDNAEQLELQRNALKLDLSVNAYMVATLEITGINTELTSTEKQITLCASTVQMVRETVNKYMPCYITTLDMSRFNILFCLKDECENAGEIIAGILKKTVTIIHNYFNVTLLCAVGRATRSTQLIYESYQSARNARINAPGEMPVVMSNDEQNSDASVFNISIYSANLTKAFEELNAEALYDSISEIALNLRDIAPENMHALDAASTLLYMAISLLPEGASTVAQIFSENSDNYRCLYKCTTVEQCCTWMLKLRDGLCEVLQTRKQSYKERVVANIKEYIQENVNKRLTLNEVASAFSFSTNYLSQLFAKYSDCGFVETVTEAKIAAAKQLMSNSEMKIYEIAESLGYESAFYFSKVFKKLTGQSPREYMQN